MNLFLPLYSWKIAELALTNNYSLTYYNKIQLKLEFDCDVFYNSGIMSLENIIIYCFWKISSVIFNAVCETKFCGIIDQSLNYIDLTVHYH
jgi:hypothetical protein